MNVNSLGGSHHPHNLRANHLYALGEAAPTESPTTGDVDAIADPGVGTTMEDGADQMVTAEALEAVRGRRAQQMADRDARFADRLTRMAEHRVAKVGEKLERIAEHHGIEPDRLGPLEEEFADAVGALREQLAEGGFQPGAVADFRHGVHAALADLREGVREVINTPDPTGSESAPPEPANPDTVAATDGNEVVHGADDMVGPGDGAAVGTVTEPVGETTDQASDAQPATETDIATGGSTPLESDRVAVDLSDSALGLDALADSIRISDAFYLDDGGPSIDIRA